MIGKLYVVPFTPILVAAVSTADAASLIGKTPQFVCDLYKEDITHSKGKYYLTKPHLGSRDVLITPAFMGEYMK